MLLEWTHSQTDWSSINIWDALFYQIVELEIAPKRYTACAQKRKIGASDDLEEAKAIAQKHLDATGLTKPPDMCPNGHYMFGDNNWTDRGACPICNRDKFAAGKHELYMRNRKNGTKEELFDDQITNR